MDFFKAIGLFFVATITLALIAVIGAYPTKWLVNYLFTPQTLLSVFGISQFGFWKALALNYLTGTFFRTTVNSKS